MLPDAAGVRLAHGTLRISGGIITAIDAALDPRADLGGEHAIITPGFVDCHLHLPQFDSIGIDGLELLDWLQRIIFPAEACWADNTYAGSMAARVARQLLSFGTTSVAAYATVHHDAAVVAMRELDAAGIGGTVGQVLMDRNAPAELLRPAAQLLDEAARLTPIGRITPAITPRFAVSCTDELLAGSGRLAAARPSPVQTHLAETNAELETIARLFPGVAYTEVYRRAGLLTPRTLLAHAIHLSDADRRSIAACGALVAHCPTANLFLEAGAMDRLAALRERMPLTLGSDVAGGPDRSMVRVARAMLETAKRLGHRPPTAAEAWHMITSGNADALAAACGAAPGSLGGSLRVGAAADVLVLHADIALDRSTDPLSTLMYAWDDRWLRHTLTRGIVRWSASEPDAITR